MMMTTRPELKVVVRFRSNFQPFLGGCQTTIAAHYAVQSLYSFWSFDNLYNQVKLVGLNRTFFRSLTSVWVDIVL